MERQELRKALRVVSGIKGALDESLDLEWFVAACDTTEEATALHAIHADRAASASRRRTGRHDFGGG